MTMRTWAVAAAFGVLAGPAFAQDVKTDFDKAANFGAIKTFDIKIGTGWNNELSEKRVLAEFQQALTEKGWTKTDQTPDAMVVLHGATDVKKTLDTFYTGGYGGYGYRGWGGMGMGSSTTSVREYAVGTLVVDIFDAKSKSLLFRGTATDELSDKPEKNQKKLAKASEKMFKDFPPGSAKKK
ncbi:MAG TPA: DUF4136 domain-containing protein [Vicinamibacteria bacterium]|nr:DUF4136 domain-containing protein [Vicinamibacteria bacterium]